MATMVQQACIGQEDSWSKERCYHFDSPDVDTTSPSTLHQHRSQGCYLSRSHELYLQVRGSWQEQSRFVSGATMEMERSANGQAHKPTRPKLIHVQQDNKSRLVNDMVFDSGRVSDPRSRSSHITTDKLDDQPYSENALASSLHSELRV